MDRPGVGVGVIVKKDDKILLLKRTGSHGAGTWSPPGGHLELNEHIEDCAVRETFEEASISIKDIRVVGFTNDIMPEDQRHYITIYVTSQYASGEAFNKEPHKCIEIGWFSWDDLPKPLFTTFRNFVEKKAYPRS